MLKPYEQRFPWRLDWNLLRTFMVVVDEGGITPAAKLAANPPAHERTVGNHPF